MLGRIQIRASSGRKQSIITLLLIDETGNTYYRDTMKGRIISDWPRICFKVSILELDVPIPGPHTEILGTTNCNLSKDQRSATFEVTPWEFILCILYF